MHSTNEVLLLMMIFVIMWSLFEFFKRMYHCRYCGGHWGQHDDGCPWAKSGTRMR